MKTAYANTLRKVTAAATVPEGTVLLAHAISNWLRKAADEPDKVIEVADAIGTNANAWAAAMEANTPGARKSPGDFAASDTANDREAAAAPAVATRSAAPVKAKPAKPGKPAAKPAAPVKGKPSKSKGLVNGSETTARMRQAKAA